jgi:hypothetical protein
MIVLLLRVDGFRGDDVGASLGVRDQELLAADLDEPSRLVER